METLKEEKEKDFKTCFICSHSTICYGYKSIKEVIKNIPVNNKKVNIFQSLAECCKIFKHIE